MRCQSEFWITVFKVWVYPIWFGWGFSQRDSWVQEKQRIDKNRIYFMFYFITQTLNEALAGSSVASVFSLIVTVLVADTQAK
jgi:hypothetical protein